MSPHRAPTLLAVSLLVLATTAACAGKSVQILDPEEGGVASDSGTEPASCTSAGGTCVASAAQCAPGQGQLGGSALSCAGGAVCCFLPPTPCATAPTFDCCEGPSGVARPRCDGETLACQPGQTKAAVGKCGCAAPASSCSTSFATGVLPLLVTSCGSPSCHGTPAGVKPQIARDDASLTRRNLLAQKPINGVAYVSDCSPDPAASSIFCNLDKTNTCGNAMPLGAAGSLAGSALDNALRAWIACGAPDN